MWYRTSITRINPTGQIDIDFGNEYKTKLDLKKIIEIRIKENSKTKKTIEAYLKNTNSLLGSLEFEHDDKAVSIEAVYVKEYTTEEMQKYLKALQEVGYQTDQSSISRRRWGIGNLLYKELKKYIKENLPYVTKIMGDVHSKEAFQARNRVFGYPAKVYDWFDEIITPEMTKKHKSLIIPTIETIFSGTEVTEDENPHIIPQGGGLTVVHKLKRNQQKQQNIQDKQLMLPIEQNTNKS